MSSYRITIIKLLGIDVRIDLSWLIIALLVTWSLARGAFPAFYGGMAQSTYWCMGVAGALGLFVSILTHEFGHSIVARRFGIPIRSITLFIFGGVAEMEGEPPNPASEFFMAIAGPITSAVLGAGAYALTIIGRGNWPLPLLGVLRYLAWINIMLAVFNMAPAFPLDGGRVLRSILWAVKRSYRWATRVASRLGSAFGVLLVILGLVRIAFGDFVGGIWLGVLGLFVRWASQASYRQAVWREALTGEPVQRFMTPNPVTISPSTSVRDLVEQYFYKYHHKMFPVVVDSELLGCVNLNQVQGLSREEWDRRTARELLRPCSPENCIEPEADAMKALSEMNRTHANGLMVVDRGHLVGVISLKDLLKFLAFRAEMETA